MLLSMSTDAPTSPSASPESRKPVSKLAVASIVVVLIPCCPLTSLVGAFLAAFSLSRIWRAKDRFGGERLAIAALLIGLAGALVQTTVVLRWQAGNMEKAEVSLDGRVTAFFDLERESPATSMWSSLEQPASVAVESFLADVQTRYGDLKSIDFMSSSRTAGASPRHVTYAVMFEFSGERVSGAVWAVIAINTDITKILDPPVLDVRGILLRDHNLGNLTLGHAAEAAESTDSTDEAEEATAGSDADTMREATASEPQLTED